MSMFISKKDTFDYVFYYKADGFRVTMLTKEEWAKLEEPKQRTYERHVVTFRPMTWGDQNECRRSAIVENPETGLDQWDGDAFVMEKLCRGIVDWDFTEPPKEEGADPVKVPTTPENIRRLHPGIADKLLMYYDNETEVSEREEKN